MSKLALLLTFAVVGTSMCASADVIAGDLGPGGTFGSVGYTVGSAGNVGLAVVFTVPSGPGYKLDQILVADHWLSGFGSSALTVGLYSGSNPNSTTLLQSFTIPASTHATKLYTLNSSLHPLLLAGNSYTLEETIGDCTGMSSCGTVWGWQFNNQLQTGYYEETGGGSWSLENSPGDITPAFAVTGAVPGAVPEPRFTPFLALSAMLIGFLQLRRRATEPSR
jgi:hypothetical protein